MGTLVLWDIDHTLIDAGGTSRDVYARAFERVTRPALGAEGEHGRT